MSEELYKSHPCMFRSKPVAFILSIALCALGIGFIILLVWWLKTLATTLIITEDRITLRTGLLSKHENEVYHADIRNVQIHQTFFQRIFKVGAVGISTAGHGGIEIEVAGLPDPALIKHILDEQRHPKPQPQPRCS